MQHKQTIFKHISLVFCILLYHTFSFVVKNKVINRVNKLKLKKASASQHRFVMIAIVLILVCACLAKSRQSTTQSLKPHSVPIKTPSKLEQINMRINVLADKVATDYRLLNVLISEGKQRLPAQNCICAKEINIDETSQDFLYDYYNYESDIEKTYNSATTADAKCIVCEFEQDSCANCSMHAQGEDLTSLDIMQLKLHHNRLTIFVNLCRGQMTVMKGAPNWYLPKARSKELKRLEARLKVRLNKFSGYLKYCELEIQIREAQLESLRLNAELQTLK